MNPDKPQKNQTPPNSVEKSCADDIDDLEKLTSIEQIDDSELPQSVKDQFKD